MQRRYSIKFTVISLFFLVTCLTAGIAIGLQYHFSKEQALGSALQRYQAISHTIASEIKEVDRIFSNLTRLLAGLGPDFEQFEHNHIARNAFAELMGGSELFYSAYIARGSGHFYQLVNLNAFEGLRERIDARPQDRWVVVEVQEDNGRNLKTTRFYDEGFLLRAESRQETPYNATKRPWYIGAQQQDLYKTEPYLFHNVPVSGQTYAARVHHSALNSVVGVDIVTLSLADKITDRLKPAIDQLPIRFFVYDESGSLKASSEDERLDELPPVTPLSLTPSQQALVADLGEVEVSNQLDWPPLDFAIRGQPAGYFVDLLRMLSLKTGVELKFINGFSWSELVAAYQQGDLDILHPLADNESNRKLAMLSHPLARFNFGVAIPDGSEVENLGMLDNKTVGILRGWSITHRVRQAYPDIRIIELDDLYSGMALLEAGQLDAMLDLEVILSQMLEQHFVQGIRVQAMAPSGVFEGADSFHLGISADNSALLSLLNLAIDNLSDEERQFLDQKWLQGESARSVVPYQFLIDAVHNRELRQRLALFNVGGEQHYGFIQQIDLFERGTEFLAITVPAESLLKQAQSNVVASTLASALLLAFLLPLSSLFSNPIVRPIHALIEQTQKVRRRYYDQVKPVPTVIKEIDELSHSIEVTARVLASYEKHQEEFVESFIKLIAQAIDDKSPYTAGHCNRVPELALMLVKEAEQAQTGSFADFAFENDRQRREFRIAAWLHDCGKITTPEHIVDKGSKLETNYNRIHEVRMRFEVLIREAMIDFYRQKAEGNQEVAVLQAQLDENIRIITEDFEFIAAANVGGEQMDPQSIDRIHRIAEQTWTRYLDDRLGLSPAEEEHLKHFSGPAPLPTQEQLLSDKAEHVIPHPQPVVFDPEFNIDIQVPESLANLGEVYNLSIDRGTLTAEDRFKINEHIISTIKMLERMPFPQELANVPRYASTHHETMKGTGYPRKLKGEDLTIPERILAVADIFEALTAADRPYKKAKPLSQALSILRKMALDDHVDQEVFNLFLESGSYLAYANKYLAPEQIDDVDVKALRIGSADS